MTRQQKERMKLLGRHALSTCVMRGVDPEDLNKALRVMYRQETEDISMKVEVDKLLGKEEEVKTLPTAIEVVEINKNIDAWIKEIEAHEDE